MLFSPWLTFREAREALRTGRLAEAQRLLEPYVADGYRTATRLYREVAQARITQAERQLRADDAEAAWVELLAAESLNTGEPRAVALRHTLTRLGLAECRAAIEAGQPLAVLDRTARLLERGARSAEVLTLESVARDWIFAAGQADRGEFPVARETLVRLRERIDPIHRAGLERYLSEIDQRQKHFSDAVSRLTEAAAGREWRDVVRWADEVVAAAPDHRESRQLRAQAWDAIQPRSTQPYRADDTDEEVPLALIGVEGSGYAATRPGQPPLPVARRSSRPAPTMARPASSPGSPLPKRFLLWIDGVGGYLVCLQPRITFGQAVGDAPVDVPLFADLSRLHAELSRDAEGYVLESARSVLVNGTSQPRSVLQSGDRITLGPTCQFLFHLPVQVSPSARLELVSGHRLPLAVEGVILMAETLILGPDQPVHLSLPPEVPGNVILYRGKDGLGVRHKGKFKIDNRPCEGRADLPLPSVVSSDSFTFAIEPVGPRL